MGEEKSPSLKRLLADFPPGSLLPTRWLTSHGYADNRLPRFVADGWLASAGRGVYRRTGLAPTWMDAVHALQSLLGLALHVGGLTALDQRGFSHFLRPGAKPVLLYGPARPPRWALDPASGLALEWRASKLFEFPQDADLGHRGLVEFRPEGFRHALRFAGEERAFLELLDETPGRASVHEADAILAGLPRLRPARLNTLLACCTRIKVKRLFLALAHRHQHAWLKHLDVSAIDLGRGKRALVPGGKLDPRFKITLPADLDAEF